MKFIFVFFLVLGLGSPQNLIAQSNTLELLKEGGKIVFIRHAYAPGGGGPVDFSLANCDTQRNLSHQGIKQSQNIGDIFQKNQISISQVLSSQWCRCQDTARYAFGDYENFSALNSTFSGKYQKNHTKQMLELSEFINRWDDSGGNLIFVTHYVIVGGFLDYYPNSGEIVIADKSLSILGTIKVDF